MSGKRRGGLGRGIGALIPTAPPSAGSADVNVTTNATTSAPAGGDPRPMGGEATEPIVDQGAGSVVTADVGEQITATPTDLAEVPGATFAELPIAEIHPNTHQPRQVFDEQALEELTHSIREFGVLQPVVVRVDPSGGYELVMGERRLRASAAAGLTEIPAIIRSTADDAMLRDALLENIHRSALNPLEEAAAYQQLLEEFGVTHDELARRIGRSRSQVSNTIRLMNLSVPVQRRVAAGVLSAGHARALLGLEDHEQQDELASRIVAEGLSVRATEELVTLAAHDAKPAARRVPTKRITAPAIAELAEKLSDTLDTRVRVDLGKRKGKITVEFGSIDDLERIVAAIAPHLATRQPS
ncbi:chromosome segregation DNA-binding protein [Jatrophihabitans sp. GAS493]|uniref:ParB/RepB/Spo0J family partition protein n=1 Tax=Jatrophihabitans sp. GAS493 TaxID=1907575 RepID=UPI000BB7746B|nr:ParB/RepB/Spo0J family partition protein [Jatrophihabitans sp. GAS493]SOD71234.1 chromosome segregation DNA-binding protein [Jatrophihabitans sp. GAS493]